MHLSNKAIMGDEVWNNYSSFLRYFAYDKTFPVYTSLFRIYPDIKDAVSISHFAHGKVFLAHLYKYPNNHQELLNYLYNYCKNNNLLISGGSDCHGVKRLNRKIGVGYNNLNINKSIVYNWVS